MGHYRETDSRHKRATLIRPVLLLSIFMMTGLHAVAQTIGKEPEIKNTIQPYLSGIMTEEATKLYEWYHLHLGFTIKDERKVPQQRIHFYLLERDGFLLEIVQRNDLFNPKRMLDTTRAKYVRGYFKTGFYVTNIKQWYDKLKLEGVTIVSENVSKNESNLYILMKDPDGNLVQLFQKEKEKETVPK